MGKKLFVCLLVCLRKKFSLKFIYEDFTIDIFRPSLFTIYLRRFGPLIIYLLFIYEMVNVQRFTKSLPKFVYVVYKAFPKFWLEFVYNLFTGGLLNNFGVRLPRFIYQNLVNVQPCGI